MMTIKSMAENRQASGYKEFYLVRTTLDSKTMSKGVALDCEMASGSTSGRYMAKTFDTESGTTADTCYVSQDESKTDAEKLGQQQEDTGWDHNQNKLTLHRSVSIYFSQTLPQKCQTYLKLKIKTLLFLLSYHIYLGYALYYNGSKRLEFCSGLGIVLVVTGLGYVAVLAPATIRFLASLPLVIRAADWVGRHSRVCRIASQTLLIIAIAVFLILDTAENRRRLVSCGGLLIFLLFAFIFSRDKKSINWSQVLSGVILQFIFGLTILRWETGAQIFECLGDKVDQFLSFNYKGTKMAYGPAVNNAPFIPGKLENTSLAYNVTLAINEAGAFQAVVVFKALSVVYFFSFFAHMLFYVGAMHRFNVALGYALMFILGTSLVESMNAAANIFLGAGMTPFLLKPYLKSLSLSELHSVLASGFATVAANLMVAYISFGISASHLLSASFMSAPAALACAKMLYPEKRRGASKSEGGRDRLPPVPESEEANLIDAATRGAASAGVLVVQMIAIIVAFVSFVALLDALVEFLAQLVGLDGWSFEWILGKIFMPVSYVMGVEWQECEKVGQLVGIKTVINEFVAYKRLSDVKDQLSPRALTIGVYALCGFTNPGALGVQIATIGGLCPERRADVSRVIARAFLAGCLACFMTASIAGALIRD